MDDLIEALTIFRSYMPKNVPFPTHCEHDILYVYPGFGADAVSETDLGRLEELTFSPDIEFADDGGWSSHLFGSC